MDQQAPTQPETPPEETPPEPCGCGDCNTGLIDDLACSAKRFQKQAEVVTQSLEEIAGYRDDFATARTRYQAALDAAAPGVADARAKLETLLADVRACHVKGRRRECLDQGLEKALACIEPCAGDPGCCVGECDFDSDPGEDSAAVLRGRIDQYTRDVTAAAACFTSVIGQITELPTRVAALTATVDAIEQDSGVKPVDWPRLYAGAIVAWWELEDAQVYAGFPRADALVDCLCEALTCLMRGWEAIAVLEGVVVELDCKAAAADAACRSRRADLVGEVMCHYDRCCDEDPPPTDPPEDCDDEKPPPKPCGCEGHHHHGESGEQSGQSGGEQGQTAS